MATEPLGSEGLLWIVACCACLECQGLHLLGQMHLETCVIRSYKILGSACPQDTEPNVLTFNTAIAVNRRRKDIVAWLLAKLGTRMKQACNSASSVRVWGRAL